MNATPEMLSGHETPSGIKQPIGFPGLPAGWSSSWETFPDSDGTLTLFATQYVKDSVAQEAEKGVKKGIRALIVLHGFGEHGGRYLHLPHYLKDSVDLIYVYDHQGHGRSQGPRGHIERFDVFADDAAAVIRRLDGQFTRRYGPSEIHVLGHSMGGLIALRLGILHHSLPIASMNVSAPFLGLKAEVPMVKKAAAHLLSRVWGSLALDADIDANVLSRDRNVVDSYVTDRLVHGKMSPRFYMQVNSVMADTLAQKCDIKPPMQVLVPLEDGLVDAELALGFCEKFEHADKSLKTYEGFRHEIMNEIGKERVFEDIASWIESHSKLKARVS